MLRLWLFVGVVLCGCPQPSVVDAGGELDAGLPDAGARDAGPPDAGPRCGVSVGSLMGCVDPSAYQAELELVTGVRPPGSAHWQLVQDHCAQRLTSYGFTVARHAYATGVNVIGVRPGTDLAAQRVLVSAHYDHIPGCAGADDNASGLAGALEVARVLAQGRYRRTLVVACWDEEERGLVGSSAWAARAALNAEEITAAFVFEMIGYRSLDADTQQLPQGLELVFPTQVAAIHQNQDRADFVALIGDDQAHSALTRFSAHAQEVSLPTVVLELTAAQKNNALFSELRRSDHAALWGQNFPAVMVGDTANFRNAHYHCTSGPDAVGDLDQAFSLQIVGATVGAAADLLELSP